MRKDSIRARLKDAANAGFKAGFDQGIDDSIKIVLKFFGSDWNGVDAIKALAKLKEKK